MQVKGQGQPIGRITCLEPTPGLFRRGVDYKLYAYNDSYVRVRGDNGRIRWYRKYGFDLSDTEIATMQSFKIDDPIYDPHRDNIEVTVTFKDGLRRWCIFVTPAWISAYFAGDLEPKLIDHGGFVIGQISVLGDFAHTKSGKHFGMVHAPHVIVISEITEETIERTLKYLDATRDLQDSTRSLDPVTQETEADETFHESGGAEGLLTLELLGQLTEIDEVPPPSEEGPDE